MVPLRTRTVDGHRGKMNGDENKREIWRCIADDDPEKEWDSTTALDALIDAEQAIKDGATKVVIQRIKPNTKLTDAGPQTKQ